MADNTAYAMDWLQKHGYSLPASAALVGHATQESGVDPNAVGDGGAAHGLFQWRDDRLAGLKSYAASAGMDPNDINTQLGFMDHELNTTERKAGDALRAATTVDDATRAGMAYERPQGYTAAYPEGGSGWNNRLGEAQRLAGLPANPAGASATPAAMLQPSVLPAAPSALAAAFVASPDNEAVRQHAVAAARQKQKQQLLGAAGGLGSMYA